MRLRLLYTPLALLVALATLNPTMSRADTVASLLGDFTINQYCGLKLGADTIDMHYVVVFGQLPALRELHLADADGNGVTTQAERDAYVATLAPGYARSLVMRVDGIIVPFHATHWTSSLPTEQGGFSLRVDMDLAAALPAADAGMPRRLEFANQNYLGQIGWREIVVEPAAGISAYDTNAFSTSLTGGLTEALKSLPATGPLDERAVHLIYRRGGAPLQASRLGARSESGNQSARAPSSNTAAAGPESHWITRRTRQLIDSISSPTIEPGVAFLTLLGALLLGAVHAFSPGHGKTIVGAYLVGSRGTPRHAVFLGITVTITHTLGVFLLGFATLYASRFIVPERLFPILSLISAVLVLTMGIILLIQRGRSARDALSAAAFGTVTIFQAVPHIEPAAGGRRGYIFAPSAQFKNATLHAHGGGRPHWHGGGALHAHGSGLLHSHGGGAAHSHLPPGAAGEKITWRGLLALGISGGLVPCPSAMVLLLAAVALNKTAYGMLLVTAFSVGLAITLTLVGLLFLYARNRFARPVAESRWTQLLPVLSAGTITVLGLVLCFGALETFRQ